MLFIEVFTNKITPSKLDCNRSGNCVVPASPSDTSFRLSLDILNFRSTTDNLVQPTGHELDSRSLVADGKYYLKMLNL